MTAEPTPCWRSRLTNSWYCIIVRCKWLDVVQIALPILSTAAPKLRQAHLLAEPPGPLSRPAVVRHQHATPAQVLRAALASLLKVDLEQPHWGWPAGKP